ncbi:MAG: peroxiredoxin [Burkholderiales bacterium]|nr:peroxiredoxin [Burkholderiales bacterium]
MADFTIASTAGEFSLSAVRGKPVVLYFYPKDNTPGCTSESADFRDLHAQFTAAGAIVLGLSRDSIRSHDSFRKKLELPFDLLSDADEAVCTQFGVIKMKNMYGKQVRGIERSTFLIDAGGTLAREWRGVKVAGHAAAVLAAVQDLRG